MRRRFRRAVHAESERRDHIARDVDDELHTYFALRVQRLIESGLTPDEAAAEAARRFGSLPETREELIRVAATTVNRMRLSDSIHAALYELRYSLRQLRRTPAFSLGVVAALAIGIGANATMFGIVDRLLLRPPSGVVDPARVVTLTVQSRFRGSSHKQRVASYPLYKDLERASDAFSDVAAYTSSELPFGDGASMIELPTERTSASYFSALGIRPLIGRFYDAAESDAAPGANVVVLGYDFWRRQFASDPGVIGHSITLAGSPFTVIGVAPRGFAGLSPSVVDAWVPITAGVTASDFQSKATSRQSYWMFVLARLRPGVTVAAAADRATASIRAGEAAEGESASDIAAEAPTALLRTALPRDANGDSPDAKVAVLVAGVSFLLLVLACANVANLQLTRAIQRRHELAVRLALGVSRRRLLAQLMLDGLLLAVFGGAGALAFVVWGGAIIRRELLATRSADMPLDLRVLGYSAVAALLTAVLTGFVPALRASRLDLTNDLKAGGRNTSARRSRVRLGLIAAQAMLATVMLVGTGLFVLSLRRIQAVPLGMDASHVNVVSLEGRQLSDADFAQSLSRVEDAARSVPGVTGAASIVSLPFYTSYAARVRIPGRDSVVLTADGGPYLNAVGGDYFAIMRARLVRGRWFAKNEGAGTPPVAIVNETVARLWWPGENPVGKCFYVGADSIHCVEIVGVVANMRRQRIVEGDAIQFFVPAGQGPKWATPQMVLVGTERDAAQMTTALRRALQSTMANASYVRVRPLDELIEPQMRSWRLGATLFGVFGGFAVVLAFVGLYAVASCDVAQQRSAIGVRMALGASAAQIGGMIVRGGMALIALGGAVGLAVVFVAARYVAPLLFQTSATDVHVLGAVIGLLALGGIGATAVPASRASHVDPIAALKHE